MYIQFILDFLSHAYCLNTHFSLFPLYFPYYFCVFVPVPFLTCFNNCISLPMWGIPMYTGCILCTYSLPNLVFYLNSASLYVNLQFHFLHLLMVSRVCIPVYKVVYQPGFQLSKVKSPFSEVYLDCYQPRFQFFSPVRI